MNSFFKSFYQKIGQIQYPDPGTSAVIRNPVQYVTTAAKELKDIGDVD